MKIVLYQYSNYLFFDTLTEAIEHCKQISLINGDWVSENFLIWCNTENMSEANACMLEKALIINHDYMRFAYKETGKNWEWDAIDNKWYAY